MNLTNTAHFDKALARLGIEGASKLIAEKGINALVDELKAKGELRKDVKDDAENVDLKAEIAELRKDYANVLTAFGELIEGEAESNVAHDKQVSADTELIEKQANDIARLTEIAEALKASHDELRKEFADVVKATPKAASAADVTATVDANAKAAQEELDKANEDDRKDGIGSFWPSN